jgi:GntR family transcriptional regulator/MocR family aminotransferase
MTRRAGGFLPGRIVDRGARLPLHEQIANHIEAAIRGDAVRPGERVPSTRALAARLGVSRNTVIAAYDELNARGLIEGRRGGGMHVADRPGSKRRVPIRAVPLTDDDGNALLLIF